MLVAPDFESQEVSCPVRSPVAASRPPQTMRRAPRRGPAGRSADDRPETGKLWREERLKDAIGDYYASPIAGDDKVYLASLDGKITVLRAGADWQVVSAGDLGEPIVATPAIADGRVFVRTEAAVYGFAVQREGR